MSSETASTPLLTIIFTALIDKVVACRNKAEEDGVGFNGQQWWQPYKAIFAALDDQVPVTGPVTFRSQPELPGFANLDNSIELQHFFKMIHDIPRGPVIIRKVVQLALNIGQGTQAASPEFLRSIGFVSAMMEISFYLDEASVEALSTLITPQIYGAFQQALLQ